MPISYRQRVKAGSYMDWVLPAMLSYPEKYTIDTVDVAEIVTAQVKEKADRKISHGQLLEQIEAADDSQVSRYDELFSYQYPYQREIGRKIFRPGKISSRPPPQTPGQAPEGRDCAGNISGI